MDVNLFSEDPVNIRKQPNKTSLEKPNITTKFPKYYLLSSMAVNEKVESMYQH